jgi:phosphoribosylamine--glycine ligase
MRIRSDFLEVFEHGVAGTLNQSVIDWDPRTALGVVMASANYPSTPRLGDSITGIPAAQPDCVVFHAGTVLKDGKVFTSGGRVLCVTALGDTVKQAQTHAYALADKLHFKGMQMRRDIGFRAIRR